MEGVLPSGGSDAHQGLLHCGLGEPWISTMRGHQHQEVLRAGEGQGWRGGGGWGDVGSGHQGSHLGKGVLLLLDRNPSTNPKVMEGHLVGNE